MPEGTNTPAIWPITCANSSCVDILTGDDLFFVCSTRRPEATPVPFDADEILKFIDEVKAGRWDTIRAQAADRIANQVFTA